MDIEKIVKESNSKSDICRALGIPVNGTGMRKVKILIKDYDTSHFGSTRYKKKYPYIIKECPVCGNGFETQLGHSKEKQTCSYACSNTFFRSGENNGSFKHGKRNYRTVCFLNHKKECIIKGCGENNIVEVHHYDEDHTNNDPSNLVPLCPTHHKYWHSGFKNLVEEEVHEYVKQYMGL